MKLRGSAALPKKKQESSSDDELPTGKGKLLARFASRPQRGRETGRIEVSSDEDILPRQGRKYRAHTYSARKHQVNTETSSSSSDSDFGFRCKPREAGRQKHAGKISGFASVCKKDSCSSCSDVVCEQAAMRSKKKETSKLLERVQAQRACGWGTSPFERAISMDNWRRRRAQYGCVCKASAKTRKSASQPKQAFAKQMVGYKPIHQSQCTNEACNQTRDCDCMKQQDLGSEEANGGTMCPNPADTPLENNGATVYTSPPVDWRKGFQQDLVFENNSHARCMGQDMFCGRVSPKLKNSYGHECSSHTKSCDRTRNQSAANIDQRILDLHMLDGAQTEIPAGVDTCSMQIRGISHENKHFCSKQEAPLNVEQKKNGSSEPQSNDLRDVMSGHSPSHVTCTKRHARNLPHTERRQDKKVGGPHDVSQIKNEAVERKYIEPETSKNSSSHEIRVSQSERHQELGQDHQLLSDSQCPISTQNSCQEQSHESMAMLGKEIKKLILTLDEKISTELQARDEKLKAALSGYEATCCSVGQEVSELRHILEKSNLQQQHEDIQKIADAVVTDEIYNAEKVRGAPATAAVVTPIEPKTKALGDLSGRLEQIERSVYKKIDELSMESKERLGHCATACREAVQDSQDERLQSIEQSLTLLHASLEQRDHAKKMNALDFRQDLQAIRDDMQHNTHEITSLRTKQQKAVQLIQDRVAKLEEEVKNSSHELQSKVESLGTKLAATDKNVTQVEKKVLDTRSGLKEAECKLCEVELLVDQVATACKATAKSVDKKHTRLKDSMGSIRTSLDLSLAKCSELEHLCSRLNNGKTNMHGGSKNYLAHVTLEKCSPVQNQPSQNWGKESSSGLEINQSYHRGKSN